MTSSQNLILLLLMCELADSIWCLWGPKKIEKVKKEGKKKDLLLSGYVWACSCTIKQQQQQQQQQTPGLLSRTNTVSSLSHLSLTFIPDRTWPDHTLHHEAAPDHGHDGVLPGSPQRKWSERIPAGIRPTLYWTMRIPHGRARISVALLTNSTATNWLFQLSK